MNRQLKYLANRGQDIYFSSVSISFGSFPRDWVTRPEVRVGSEKRRNNSSNRDNREVSTIFA
jgi:hypothetical protein